MPISNSEIMLGCVVFAADGGRSGAISWFVEEPDSPDLRVEQDVFTPDQLHPQQRAGLSEGDFVCFGRPQGRFQGIERLSEEDADAAIHGSAESTGTDKGWPKVPQRLRRFARRVDDDGACGPDQHYLHPDLAPSPEAAAKTDTLNGDKATYTPAAPFKTSGFAYRPALSQLEPGDLILIEAWSVPQSKKNMTQWVQMAQHYDRSPDHAATHWAHSRWHHAAVYIGAACPERSSADADLCEASFASKKVKRVSLCRYNERDDNGHNKTNRLRVRRLRNISAEQRARIAIRACEFVDTKYDQAAFWTQALNASAQGLLDVVKNPVDALTYATNRDKGVPQTPLRNQQFTCAALYAHAFHLATGQPLAGCEDLKKISPSRLSASEAFFDLETVQWESQP